MLLRGDAWRGATADTPEQAQQLLADALQKYQARAGGCRMQGEACSGLGCDAGAQAAAESGSGLLQGHAQLPAPLLLLLPPTPTQPACAEPGGRGQAGQDSARPG